MGDDIAVRAISLIPLVAAGISYLRGNYPKSLCEVVFFLTIVVIMEK